MRIALDVMGGDHAPAEVLAGAKQALSGSGELSLALVGDREAILGHWPEALDEPRVRVVHCAEVIGMGENPAMAYRRKKDASITVASRLVKNGEAEAVVSAGSTGAQLVAALFEIGRIPGVTRPATAVLVPTLKGPRVLLDTGANVDSTPEIIRQFAWLGKIYCEISLGIPEPKVYLLSNGSEKEKGDGLTIAAHALLEAERGLGFAGNIEGRDLLSGYADVIVTDGFAGNVALKTMEGTALTLFSMMKDAFTADVRSKLGAFLLLPALRGLRAALDYEEVGGAPLLGIAGLSIVCHGSSKAKAIKAAILKASGWIESGLMEKLAGHKFD